MSDGLITRRNPADGMRYEKQPYGATEIDDGFPGQRHRRPLTDASRRISMRHGPERLSVAIFKHIIGSHAW